ncbi:hypothetical protein BY458DRAFT_522367 [Sporodiniella umbellata]|nr:hypothetical protein BY458DRAFT_522367 [Sporodiniella umbellata]
MPSILDNVFLFSTLIVSYIAWLIAFVGACVLGRAVGGGAWWIVVYELLLILGVTCVLVTNTFLHYRLMILAFLGASIALLTVQLDFLVPSARVYKGAFGAYAAGYILLIMIQFIWVMLFGSDPESSIGRYGPCHHGNAVGVRRPQDVHTDEKTVAPVTSSPTVTIDPTHHNLHSNEPSQPSPIEYREKVKALHTYTANPEDPNELNFNKGETLEIVDRTGNWWQARKSDGTQGIIPSNYFAS